MLHDWAKVLESPVFRNGFKPMAGHDGLEAKGSGEKEKEKEKERVVGVSEHAEVHMKREKEAEALGKIELTAN